MAGVRTGDDLFGLAHGFLAAGASSVLASLWYVRQGVGVEVSRRFYELWKGAPGKPGIGKAAALRAAQSEALRKKVWFGLGRPYAHPYQWAAFQLYGDWH
jgi:CHAT domain-containing protein